MSAAGTGSYLTWSASAVEAPVVKDGSAARLSATINIDSLYTAKTQESTDTTSASQGAMQPEHVIAGRVSWYGPGFHGHRTANGERFDRNEMTCAHRTLPFGTLVRVVDEATGRSVLVRVNDRGPYCGGRVLDLSEAAARRLGITGRGTASARLEVYSPQKANGESGVRKITYDCSGRAIRTQGYTVKLATFGSFDEAISEQHHLEGQGMKDLFLTEVHMGTRKTVYTISTGLFSTEHLCSSLLADVSSAFSAARVTTFDLIAADDATGVSKLADTSTGDRGNL
ncbi:MAG: septal ring lytic transglycosylase RlpA family protein [Bacteroidetes bacterium]|nr:septal ring lytic transglycosylase RlpA family protein [Bacteroidota bacterium]